MGCDVSAKLYRKAGGFMSRRKLDNYPDVLTVDDIIEILMIGRNKTYQLIKEGRIKTIRIGRKHRIAKKILIDYIESS